MDKAAERSEQIVYRFSSKAKPTKYIDFDGTLVNVSYIPAGIALPIQEIYQEYLKIAMEVAGKIATLDDRESVEADLQGGVVKHFTENPEALEKENDLNAEIVSRLAGFYNPAFTKQWVMAHMTIREMADVAKIIVENIIAEYLPEIEGSQGDKKKLTGSPSFVSANTSTVSGGETYSTPGQ